MANEIKEMRTLFEGAINKQQAKQDAAKEGSESDGSVKSEITKLRAELEAIKEK